jgi:hypothetical protein
MLQIAFGFMLVFSQNDYSINVLLPMSVSGFSLLLSLANVFLDFAGILTQLDEEQRLQGSILTSSAAEQQREKKRLGDGRTQAKQAVEQEHKDTLAKIRSERQAGKITAEEEAERTVPVKARRASENEEIEADYHVELATINESVLMKLKTELTAFRTQVKEVRKAMKGASTVQGQQAQSRVECHLEQRSAIEKKIQEIEADFKVKMEEIDVSVMTCDEVEHRMNEITKEKESKKQAFKGYLNSMCQVK